MSGEQTVTPALPSDLKQKNRRMVLSAFRDSAEHTAAEISATTGISKLTVMRAIQFFCARGLLESCGKGVSTELGGKKPEIFRLRCMQYILNIIVWPETLSLTLFDMSCDILGVRSLDWQIPASPDEAFSVIEQQSNELLSSFGIGHELLFGVNFSTSGIVDYDTVVLKYNVNAPGWGTNVPVGNYLRRIFGEAPHISAENTGKSIARAVMADGNDSVKRTLVLFTSWGLSASLIQNGRIQNGRDSIIGEVGHMIIDPNDDELCRCGSRGCLERLVGTSRLRRHLRESPPPSSSPLHALPPDTVQLRQLFDASRAGDGYARDYVRYLASCFSVMLRNVALSFNPEVIVFVGDYAEADEYFEECIFSELSVFRYLPEKPFEIRYDRRPLLSLDAVGGAIWLQNMFFDQNALYLD